MPYNRQVQFVFDYLMMSLVGLEPNDLFGLSMVENQARLSTGFYIGWLVETITSEGRAVRDI